MGTIFFDNSEKSNVETPTANWLDCSLELMTSSSLLIFCYLVPTENSTGVIDKFDGDINKKFHGNRVTNRMSVSKVTLQKKPSGFATFTIKDENHTMGNILRL